MLRRFLSCLVLWGGLGAATAAAVVIESAPGGGKEEKVELMDELVVGATKTERLRSMIPASVTVITKQELAQSPERNLDEVLRQQVGIDITRRQGIAIGIPARLDVRGVPGPNRTLVLVDGFPLNGSGTGFVSLQQIPLETIERVEIIRGPYSCLYGANALGGVINIITKHGEGRPEVSALGGVGTYSWYQAGVQSGGGHEKASYYAYGDTRRTRTYWFSTYELKETFNRIKNRSFIEEQPANNRYYEDWRHVGNYTAALTDTTRLTLHTRYFKNFTGLGLTDNLKQLNREEQDRGETFFGGFTLRSVPTERASLLLRGYFRHYTDELWNETSYLKSIFIPFPPPGRFITIPAFGAGFFQAIYQDYFFEGQTSVRLGNHHTLTGGFDFLNVSARFDPIVDAGKKTPFPGASFAKEGINTFAFYLQDEIQVGNFNLIPGIRVDKHSLFQVVVSPKLGISYKPIENLVLRTSAGRAYRAPSVTELFRPEWNLNPFIRLRPNPDLKPEYIWSVDGGLEYRITPSFRVSVDGFYNNMKNFIITPPLAGSPGIIQYTNLASSWSTGMEATAEWRAFPWLTLFGNYTFLQSYDQENKQPIQSLPDHKFNLGVRLDKKWGDWRVSGTLVETYVGSRLAQPLGSNTFVDTKGFALTDLALYLHYREVATLGVTVQNLFDKKYMEAYGYLGPGRLVTGYAALRWRF
jgi:outer membrane cobalamin receptor